MTSHPDDPQVKQLGPIRFRSTEAVDEYLAGLDANGRYEVLGYRVTDVGGRRPYEVTAQRRPAS